MKKDSRNHVRYSPVSSATDKAVKGSVQKIGLVAKLISGMQVDNALLQLQFAQKRVAKSLYSVLHSAIANAAENVGVGSEQLYVYKVNVGRAFNIKRFHARGRGRASKISKPFSRVEIYIGERE
jgi:large subunit ribosomal protein L22